MTSWLDAAAVEVVPAGPIAAALPAPASKSVTNRAILVAALAEGTSRLRDALVSDDTHAMCGAVTALGARCTSQGTAIVVEGTGGRMRPRGGGIDAGLSGTTLRFVAAAAALADDDVTVGGAPPLLRRPIGPLTQALRDLGARASDAGGLPPITVGGGLDGGPVDVDVATSSQYLSAVLLAAPYARADVVARGVGQSADAYIALTADLMRRWGAHVVQDGATWRVVAGRRYRARDEVVEYDASAAAHLYALAAASGGSVTVTNVAASTLQPDARLPDVLASMGCTVTENPGAVTVVGPDRLGPAHVDLSAMPDQVTTVAALAALAPGETVITGVGVTRGHETDRLAALAQELRKLDVDVNEEPDGLTVAGGGARVPARLATHGDHRLAMAFAAVALAVPGVVIEDPGCVAKTYPGFWDDLERSGVRLRPGG